MPEVQRVYRNQLGQEFYRETLRISWIRWLLEKVMGGAER